MKMNILAQAFTYDPVWVYRLVQVKDFNVHIRPCVDLFELEFYSPINTTKVM